MLGSFKKRRGQIRGVKHVNGFCYRVIKYKSLSRERGRACKVSAIVQSVFKAESGFLDEDLDEGESEGAAMT